MSLVKAGARHLLVASAAFATACSLMLGENFSGGPAPADASTADSPTASDGAGTADVADVAVDGGRGHAWARGPLPL